MPGITGLELQQKMNEWKYPLPIIFLTGHGEIYMAVRTLKLGAKDFLTKPVNPERLLTSLAFVVDHDLKEREMGIDEAEWRKRLEQLTERELSVIRLAVRGLLNREIAEALGISERTVQAHRLSAYRKLGAHNAADLSPLADILAESN